MPKPYCPLCLLRRNPTMPNPETLTPLPCPLPDCSARCPPPQPAAHHSRLLYPLQQKPVAPKSCSPLPLHPSQALSRLPDHPMPNPNPSPKLSLTLAKMPIYS
ncbi:hypothetical protein KP509_02G069400 [Ceratopteris richardii]|uniref:Uncharacterized protein n=1 Tax=Ceratopteris richardii TaxID=49495 RepID=A0A8T2RWU3_CERRI|nr:hypothetical protein KP509_24G048900 [Ceratopteris richardii]KAH7300824.1 hypothetical protein KP509_24G080400 [Ceratopteris richardii]KAH7437075.1 hypothetical protein KP509_05G055300 [Ceratopteris richardii]KAH7444200.1 hypothetical protein KP509_02G069400 [Ceratopteris richardii]